MQDDAGDVDVQDFGPVPDEDEDVQFLMHHELVAFLTQLKMQRDDQHTEVPAIMNNALDFCKGRADCKEIDPSALRGFAKSIDGQLRDMTEGHKDSLSRYEIAQLVNLMHTPMPDKDDPRQAAEEPKSIIRSLQRFSDEFVNEVLGVLKSERDKLKLASGVFDEDDDDDDDDGREGRMEGVNAVGVDEPMNALGGEIISTTKTMEVEVKAAATTDVGSDGGNGVGGAVDGEKSELASSAIKTTTTAEEDKSPMTQMSNKDISMDSGNSASGEATEEVDMEDA
jgi:hypothetical protein